MPFQLELAKVKVCLPPLLLYGFLEACAWTKDTSGTSTLNHSLVSEKLYGKK